MSERQIMMAHRTGVIRSARGRATVRKGVTTAHSDHPIVTQHPQLWAPIGVDYATGSPELRPPDVFDSAVGAAGLAYVEQLRRLLAGLALLGLQPTDVGSDVAAATVDAALRALGVDPDTVETGADMRTLDEEPADPEPVDATTYADEPEPDLGGGDLQPMRVGVRDVDGDQEHEDEAHERADRNRQIRAWAADAGVEVSARGKIPAEVVEQYEQAHQATQ
ncbi:Lsr2 family DNA-binding protein [Mangrovihabitans endophyticus]|uniref:Lsr2 DNA-binding domain-containing protein n=1 Tax=Mangrovihabitans endophyticus TaxID=1751298 RepID=A0A8J3C077_9ACTN|nr:histone-like nucleoid-structuring protein Lsr2 [Mangrovihabitans endophyticus]GGK89184.1 hypothetical protein GCM10012284_24000 [Mangrovihabitans endophyticus]